MDRRQFLAGTVASLPLAYPFPSGLGLTQDAGQGRPVLIPRQRNPDNLEFPFHTLDRFITPNNVFYVRSHFRVPELDTGSWRLKVEGAVERPSSLTYDDLRRIQSRTLTATLECAGNNRAFLVPKVKGVAWELGAVSNAEWTGVPLAALLDRAGVKDRAVEVILEGADSGPIKDEDRGHCIFLAEDRGHYIFLAGNVQCPHFSPLPITPSSLRTPAWSLSPAA